MIEAHPIEIQVIMLNLKRILIIKPKGWQLITWENKIKEGTTIANRHNKFPTKFS
jgi:hypothetical protein